MRLITLTLKDGVKVYVNPAYIIAISACGDEGCYVDLIDESNSLEALESAESVAKMVEGE